MGSLLTKWAGILFIYSAPARVQTAQGAGCFIVARLRACRLPKGQDALSCLNRHLKPLNTPLSACYYKIV